MADEIEDWDGLFNFVRFRFGEIGLTRDVAEKFIATLRKRFYNNWEMKNCYQGCSRQVTAVLNNLDPTSQIGSTELLESIVDGKISPDKLAYMNHMELSPGVWENDIKEIELRSNVVIEEVWTEEYECDKCGARKQTVTTAQLRSADEGQTLIITCVCNNRWYIYN